MLPSLEIYGFLQRPYLLPHVGLPLGVKFEYALFLVSTKSEMANHLFQKCYNEETVLEQLECPVNRLMYGTLAVASESDLMWNIASF